MKLLLSSAAFVLFSLLFSCSHDLSPTAVISAQAVGNWVNFNGIPLRTTAGAYNRDIRGMKDIVISPSGFYIDIRLIRIRNDAGEWTTLLDKPAARRIEITGISPIAPRSPVKTSYYSEFQIGLGEDWYLQGSFTNSSGEVSNFCITNTNSKTAQYLTFNTAFAGTNNKGYNFKSGEYKQLYLFFDTIGMIHILTDSLGNISNVSISRPTLEINIY
ncbi:MAG: hypothetical protein ABSG94_04775 [Brevinematales bacterium]|jgi:hypothetical protein